jgi:hypothetical protein
MARGVVTGIKPGMVTITASYVEGGITVTGTVMVTVTGTPTGVTISPGNATLSIGGTQNYTTTLLYSDGSSRTIPVSSTEMICVSSDTNIATIQPSGNNRQGRCLAAGTVTLTCTYTPAGTTTSVSGTTPLNCQDRVPTTVVVTPTTQTVPLGSTVPYTCTANFADGSAEIVTTSAETTWTTSDGAIATVNSTGMTKGQAATVGQGTVTVTCTFRGVAGNAMLTVGPVAPTGLTVSPPSTTLTSIGGTAQLEAFLQMSNNTSSTVTNTVNWTTTGGAVDGGTPLLTVTNAGTMRGLVTVTSLPTTNTIVTITATYTGTGGTMFTAQSRITVQAP